LAHGLHICKVMSTSHKPLSKAEEMNLFRRIVADCPVGYVKSILLDILPEVDRAITSDFGFISFAEHQKAQAEERAALQEMVNRTQALKAEVRDLLAKRDLLDGGLTELRSMARRFAQL